MIWILSAPMNSDKAICPPKLGDIVWTFDVDSDMKVPLEVVKLYEDGTWDGAIAWTWGVA